MLRNVLAQSDEDLEEKNQAFIEENEVILIDVYFENNTGESYDPTLDFRVIFGDEFAMQYPLGDVTFEILEDGESNTVTLAYEIHGEPERIDLKYGNEIMVFNNDETIIFDVTPE